MYFLAENMSYSPSPQCKGFQHLQVHETLRSVLLKLKTDVLVLQRTEMHSQTAHTLMSLTKFK